jgi:small-conductance mechanosensitive channel
MNAVESAVDWVDRAAHEMPSWLVTALILAIAVALAVLLHGALFRLVERLFYNRLGEFGRRLLHRVFRPTCVGAVILALSIAAEIARIQGRPAQLLDWVLLLAFIVFIGWSAVIVLDTAADLYMRRFRPSGEDPILARRHITQMRLLRRTAIILIYFMTFSALLMAIPSIRQLGISLFASAGVAGLVVGLAARPLLSNFIAGIQIAVTQPLRIGDDVIMEGEFGTIEEIRTTYVVLKTWDWRRLILPLSSVTDKPFQNWTLSSSSQIGTVFWYIDYMTPTEPIRERFNELVKDSKLWDGQVAVFQVTDITAEAVQVRGLVSAASPGAAWDLRCEIREKLLRWIQDAYPQSLPLIRRLNITVEQEEDRAAIERRLQSGAGHDGLAARSKRTM